MSGLRSDVVGSLLRPAYLVEARAGLAAGRLSPAEFKRIEDRAVDEAVRLQEDAGLDVVTDGAHVKRAFVPTLPYAGFGDAYQQKAAAYADEAAALFSRYGFTTRRYDASDIFFKKGGGHCVSVPAPG